MYVCNVYNYIDTPQTKTRETQAQPYPTDKSTRKPNVWGSVLNLGVYENLG